MMSGVPKRSHEEGVVTLPSSSKYLHEDSVSSYPKFTPPAAAAAAAAVAAYKAESRTVKGARSEPRDGERRSPIQAVVYRSPSLPASVSSSGPHLTHTPVMLESSKDARVENREDMSDAGEIHGEAKREIQGPKSEISADESNIRNDGRDIYGEAEREIQGPKSDRDAKSERLGDDFNGKSITIEGREVKDGHGHLAWKEQKDYHRGKRAEGSTQVGVKDSSEGPHLVGLGENKVDAKSEDRFIDKDKKRKDFKHREWDRNDRRGSVLAGGIMSETKDFWKRRKRSQ